MCVVFRVFLDKVPKTRNTGIGQTARNQILVNLTRIVKDFEIQTGICNLDLNQQINDQAHVFGTHTCNGMMSELNLIP